MIVVLFQLKRGITATELASNSVTTAKIADGNVTKAKLSSDVQASLALADGAVQNEGQFTDAGNSDLIKNKTVIAAIQSTAAQVDTNTTNIASNTSAIDVLKGSVTTEGSVLKSIKDNAATGIYSSTATYDDGTIGAAIKALEEGGGQAEDIAALKRALGGSFNDQTGEWTANLEISTGDANYGNYTVHKVEVALEKIMSNIGSADDLGESQNGVTVTNTVNKNITALNSTIGSFADLNPNSTNFTNGRPTDEGYNVPENVVGVLNNIDSTLGTVHGLSDKLRAANKYNGNLSDKGTVEEHLTAVDASIGDRSKMNNTTFSGYNNIADMDVAEALTSVASSVGTSADLGSEYNGVSATNTVNKNISSLNSAIGDISSLRQTVYASDAENLTDAISALDSNIYRLDNQVYSLDYRYRKLNKEFRTGMASMAAMTALAPNARAKGDTQLTIGTGSYSGNTAAAIGLYHWISNNIMVNMGVAWGSSTDAVYRMGVTLAW